MRASTSSTFYAKLFVAMMHEVRCHPVKYLTTSGSNQLPSKRPSSNAVGLFPRFGYICGLFGVEALNEAHCVHSTRPSTLLPTLLRFVIKTQSDGVKIDLSGEASGVRSDALVNKPLEPRLFVYRRDGSALELLRNDDAQNWCVRVSRMSPTQSQQQQSQHGHDDKNDGGWRTSVEGPARAVDVREHQCCSDPRSQGARQVSLMLSDGESCSNKGIRTVDYLYIVPTCRARTSIVAPPARRQRKNRCCLLNTVDCTASRGRVEQHSRPNCTSPSMRRRISSFMQANTTDDSSLLLLYFVFSIFQAASALSPYASSRLPWLVSNG